MHTDLNDISTTHGNHYYLIAGICLFVAEWVRNLDNYHIPEVVMQLFQIAAWSATVIACIIGVYLNYKKTKNKYHDPN